MSTQGAKYLASSTSWRVFWHRGRHLLEAHAKLFNIDDVEAYIGNQQEIIDAEGKGLFEFTILETEDRCLVGHLIWLSGPHNKLPGLLVARMGPWYIDPAHRSASNSGMMMEHSLGALKLRGVDVAMPTLPLRGREKAAMEGRGLRRFGAVPIECVWQINLKEGPQQRPLEF